MLTSPLKSPLQAVMHTPMQGVPVLRYINGILSILLVDFDGAPLQDFDGAYLYEVY